MITVSGKPVVLSEQVLLRRGENNVVFSADGGLQIEVVFLDDGADKPAISPRFETGKFLLPLSNFGSPLGMAVSGRISAQKSATHPRGPGVWSLAYSLSVHRVGEEVRLVTLTVTEERVA